MGKIIQGITAGCMLAFAPFASASVIATFELPDALDLNQFDGNIPGGIELVLGSNSLATDGVTTFGDLPPIDNTFTGSVEFRFTINHLVSPNNAYNYFVVRSGDENDPVGDRPIVARVGTEWAASPWMAGNPGDLTNLLDDAGDPVPVVSNVPVSFEMVIDYVAGQDDSLRFRMVGQDNWTTLSDRDYGFTNITAQAGHGGSGSGPTADITNMSVVVIPEPATMAMVFGAVVLGLVILRRRAWKR